MISRCWLHIGTGKTGTTSIQYHLARNRSALLAQGFLYPVAPGPGNHHALSAFALEDNKMDDSRARLGIVDATRLERLRHSLPDSLEREIAACGVPNLVLSNEVLAVRMRRTTELERLKRLCDRVAASTKVIVYIRNQVDYLVGVYTTSVIEGSPRDFDPSRGARSADYARLLARWTSAFGRENVIVRRYEKESFAGGDVRNDFLCQLEIDPATLTRTRYLNRSPDAESIAFVRGLNRRVPSALVARSAPVRHAIVAVLGKRRGGAAFKIARTMANRIEDRFRASNAQVAREYFPSLQSALFSPPSCVDSTGTDKPLPWGRALGMAATLVPLSVFWYSVSLVRRLADMSRPTLPAGFVRRHASLPPARQTLTR